MTDTDLHKIPILTLETYRITRNGDIWNSKFNTLLSSHICNGYYYITLNNKSYAIHRLVAITFIKNDNNNPVVNHIDCNKLNNNVKNLEWVSQKQNVNAHNKITSHPKRVKQLNMKNEIIHIFDSLIDAADHLKISPSAISKVVIGQNQTACGYKWIYDDTNHNPIIIDFKDSKVITNFNKYRVFKDGRIYNIIRKTFVKPIINASGYCYVTLCNEGKKQNIYVHRIVANHFIVNKYNKQQINHRNKVRNDNHVDNLEWVTQSENMIHANKYLVPN
jgi:hypothetical protein